MLSLSFWLVGPKFVPPELVAREVLREQGRSPHGSRLVNQKAAVRLCREHGLRTGPDDDRVGAAKQDREYHGEEEGCL
jgi:hypothetical protein